MGCGEDNSQSAPATTAAQVVADAAAEAQDALVPDTDVETVVLTAFANWAAANGERYRDVQVAVTAKDDNSANIHVLASFRAAADPWKEREAQVGCKRVGTAWQCAPDFSFTVTAGELERQAASRIFVEPVTSMTFMCVQAGEFLMGASSAQVNSLIDLCSETNRLCNRSEWDDERPQHKVYLDEYWIGQTEE